jgi:hypothetical protein
MGDAELDDLTGLNKVQMRTAWGVQEGAKTAAPLKRLLGRFRGGRLQGIEW